MAGPKRRHPWLALLAVLAILAAVAAAVAYYLSSSKGTPAPTSSGTKAIGTISGPDINGFETYDNPVLRFRFRYPAKWDLKETSLLQTAEGEYITVVLAPPTSSGTLAPPELQVSPDPQGFSAEQLARLKYGSVAASLTVETATVDVAKSQAIQVRLSDLGEDGKRLYTYEVIAALKSHAFVLHIESADATELDSVAEQALRVMQTLETY